MPLAGGKKKERSTPLGRRRRFTIYRLIDPRDALSNSL